MRDLLLAARAVDDPTDELALVATLRSALFGCGDDNLWRWRKAGGRWHVFAPAPDEISPEDPVAEAMSYLRGLVVHKPYLSPSALLDRLVRDRRVLEAAVASPRYRETWRRVCYAIDQARAWSEAEHGSLREYLGWAERQAAKTTRVNEVVLSETDADSIRIVTIHSAKGLQFPMVIVSGLTARPPSVRPRCCGMTGPPDGTCASARSRPKATAGPSTPSSSWSGARRSACSMSPAPGPKAISWCRSTGWRRTSAGRKVVRPRRRSRRRPRGRRCSPRVCPPRGMKSGPHRETSAWPLPHPDRVPPRDLGCMVGVVRLRS